MNENSGPRELPTKQHTMRTDDAVQKSFRQFAMSTGLTSNLALHALLNCFDTYGDAGSALAYAATYEPGPTRPRKLIADDATYMRFRALAATLGVTSNVALSVLLECFREYGGPVRVEGGGLRVPCAMNSPCAPDAPSAGPVAIRHVKPTRLRARVSTGGQAPARKDTNQDGPGGEKAALLRALIAEEGSRARIYRRSAAILSALTPDAGPEAKDK